MKIVFVSNTCSEKKYREINKIKTRNLLNPSQKYFSLLIEGLIRNKNCTSLVQITSLPVAQSNCKKRLFLGEKEDINKKHVIYYPGFLNLNLLKT